MTILAERRSDGYREKFTDVEWTKMTSRGDARKWKVIERIAEPPAEIAAAVTAMKKRKAASALPEWNDEEAKPVTGEDEENE